MSKWEQANYEIEKAFQVRTNGNEGMARVCARRAAGFAIQSFLEARHLEVPSQNVIHLLNDDQVRAQLPREMVGIADHLLMKVDENYQFDPSIDLLAETKALIEGLQTLQNKSE